ncbi:TRAF-like [Sesbania bispinosa]|nr:TRAF-like [Sesbania bispinosa]
MSMKRSASMNLVTAPLSGCDFVATSKVLSIHVKHQHEASRIQFLYDHSFFVSLKPEDKAFILQEQTDGKLFILNNNVMHLGYMLEVRCIGPNSSKQGYHYDILAKSQRWTLKLESFMENVQRGTFATISSNFLGIPFDNFSSLEPLKLEICIYKDNATHSAEDRGP